MSVHRRLWPASRPVPVLLTQPQAAQMLGVTPNRVCQLRKAGKLTVTYRIGDTGRPVPMYERAAVEALKAQREAAAS